MAGNKPNQGGLEYPVSPRSALAPNIRRRDAAGRATRTLNEENSLAFLPRRSIITAAR
jgi:hypothetical protein